MRKILCLLIVGFIQWGCHSATDISDFDEAAFRQDPGGCKNIRYAMKEKLFTIEDELKGLGEEEVMQLLGKSDRHELASRGQKSFVYYIEPSPECEQSSAEKPLTMYIRFSALDVVTEVSFQNY